jgi:hypothetical protein
MTPLDRPRSFRDDLRKRKSGAIRHFELATRIPTHALEMSFVQVGVCLIRWGVTCTGPRPPVGPIRRLQSAAAQPQRPLGEEPAGW